MQLSIQTVKEAHNRIKPYIINTPIKSNNEINNLVDADIYFKCENLQNSGSFKFRGASNAIFSLNDDDVNNGVITVSSGNHGTALSLAAKNRGIKATVILPSNATSYKRNLIEELGAHIIECEPTVESREKTLLYHQEKSQAHHSQDQRLADGHRRGLWRRQPQRHVQPEPEPVPAARRGVGCGAGHQCPSHPGHAGVSRDLARGRKRRETKNHPRPRAGRGTDLRQNLPATKIQNRRGRAAEQRCRPVRERPWLSRGD